jgi:hypothetical protein
MDPIKYLMKYFNINADQDTLAGVQGLGESIARLEAPSRTSISVCSQSRHRFSPPEFITKHYEDLFWAELGAPAEEGARTATMQRQRGTHVTSIEPRARASPPVAHVPH